MYIEKIEVAPSGRSSCRGCRAFILKGVKRGVASEMAFGNRQNYYYCAKHTEERLRAQITESLALLTLLKS